MFYTWIRPLLKHHCKYLVHIFNVLSIYLQCKEKEILLHESQLCHVSKLLTGRDVHQSISCISVNLFTFCWSTHSERPFSCTACGSWFPHCRPHDVWVVRFTRAFDCAVVFGILFVFCFFLVFFRLCCWRFELALAHQTEVLLLNAAQTLNSAAIKM